MTPARAETGAGVPANLVAALGLQCTESTSACGAGSRGDSAHQDLAVDELHLLENRLRETDAVSWLGKIELSARVNDLYASFQQHHHQVGDQVPLDTLRGHFDDLFDRVLAMVQHGDPELYRDIRAARNVVWVKLMDPQTFADRLDFTASSEDGR